MLKIFILVMLLSSMSSQPDPAKEGQKEVRKLSFDAFQVTVNKGKNTSWFILFHTPSCTHCIRFKPIFYKIAFDMKNSPTDFGEVDCQQEPNICKMLNIRSYPSLYYIRDGLMYKYSAQRSEEGIKDFIKGEYKEHNALMVPDTLPGFFEEILIAFSEMRNELTAVFNSGNYWAIGIIGFFGLLSLVMLLGIVYFGFLLCFQSLFSKKRVTVTKKKDE